MFQDQGLGNEQVQNHHVNARCNQGDPALVAAARNAWPDPGNEAARILDTPQSTLAINRFWIEGRGWDSNAHRAALLRSNVLRHWNASNENGDTPKIMAKLGGNHIVRGRNMTGAYDLGTLLHFARLSDRTQENLVLLLPV